MREPGYYWVKWVDGDADEWECEYWNGDEWMMYTGQSFKDLDIFQINETRLLNPDEVKEHDNKREG